MPPPQTRLPTTGEDDDAPSSSFPTGMLMYSLSERRIIVYADGGGMPEMMAAEDNACFSTPQGWVLIIGYGEATTEAWLWHPLTGDTVALPPIRGDHDIPINCKCLLTHASAAHPECAVVLLDVADPVMWFCKVNAGGGRMSSWGQHRYDIGDYGLPEEFRTASTPTKVTIADVAASRRGKLHFTFASTESAAAGQEKVCIVDLVFRPEPDHGDDPPTAVLREFDVPKLKFPQGMRSGTVWLVESREELFAVCVCYVDFDPDDIGAVLVYRMDFSDDDESPVAWRRVCDIGDRAFLLADPNMATWCSAGANGLKGNTVCFLRNRKDDDGDLCIYDIQAHNQRLEIVRTKPYWINVPPSPC
ncbi:hypothetical protein BS78_02G369600 [Paspalum vaginatum]|nr:hypothetical protein BS78_02G369600 [Paspalum vaginatum]